MEGGLTFVVDARVQPDHDRSPNQGLEELRGILADNVGHRKPGEEKKKKEGRKSRSSDLSPLRSKKGITSGHNEKS